MGNMVLQSNVLPFCFTTGGVNFPIQRKGCSSVLKLAFLLPSAYSSPMQTVIEPLFEKVVRRSVRDAVYTLQQLESEEGIAFIADFAQILAKTFSSGHKVLIAGNGGSLADAIHFA